MVEAIAQKRAPGPTLEPPRHVLIGLVSTLFVLGSLGWALSPLLFVHAPLLLVALTPSPRHVLMVAPLVSFPVLVTVVVLRRQLSCVAAYFLGQAYGERALSFTETKRPRTGRFLRGMMKLFERMGPFALVAAPNLVSVFAGSARTRLAIFIPATLLGQAGWAIVTYRVGDALKEYILPLVEIVAQYMLPLTLFTIAVVVIRQLYRRHRRAMHSSINGE